MSNAIAHIITEDDLTFIRTLDGHRIITTCHYDAAGDLVIRTYVEREWDEGEGEDAEMIDCVNVLLNEVKVPKNDRLPPRGK